MSKNQLSSQKHLRCKNCYKRSQLNSENKIDDLINKDDDIECLSISITQQELNDLKLSNSKIRNQFESSVCNHDDFKNDTKNEENDLFYEVDENTNWQNRKNCLLDKLNHMFLNEDLSDVYFIVGQERIVAHKFVLSISSNVFTTMFYGTGQKMNQSNEIELPDIDVQSFKSFLRYLYTDEIIIEHETVMSILYISKKYSVRNLEIACVEYLRNNLKIDNAFMLLQQAKLFDEAHLIDLCLELIDKYPYETFSTDCFLEIDLSLLKSIIKRDTLNIKESNLYEFLLKWARVQCQKNSIEIKRENLIIVLDDAINYIRFPLMIKEDFAQIVSLQDNRLLNDEEIIEMFLYLTLNNPKRETKFNTTPRCDKSKQLSFEEQIINRFSQVESRWGYSGTSDRIRFNVDSPIYIVGIGVYGSIYGKCDYQVLLQLIHFETCNICAQNNLQFTCDGSNSTFRIAFREPVKIEPNTDYILAATLKGPDSYYGTKGLRTIIHNNPTTGKKITFHFQFANGNNNGSSVEDGQIPEIIFLYERN